LKKKNACAFAVAALRTAQGLVALLTLNLGVDYKLITAELFAMLVVMVLFNTIIAGPIVALIYRVTGRHLGPSVRGEQQKQKESQGLTVISCVLGLDEVPSLMAVTCSFPGNSNHILARFIEWEDR
jgi:membrane protein required for beta-lactamase induction